jgi:chemotaxis protein methyltransferase CheR
MSALVEADLGGETSRSQQITLSKREFEQLRDLIESNLGISVADNKRAMLETRIARRMRELSLSTISEYCKLLFGADRGGQERQAFFDLVTTNKTSFFREREQLDMLAQDLLPALLETAARERRPLRVWSAACSTGQEVWTLAMMLDQARTRQRIQAEFVVLGSDISTRVLKTAISAKYSRADLEELPRECEPYFMRSKTPGHDLLRVVPELRRRAGFFRQNLMDDELLVGERVDLVLLRNALIYFPRERQHAIVRRVNRMLRGGGLFLVGLTETLHGTGEPLVHLGRSIYQREAAR